MAKEWILNSVMNRFQLNYKRNVGATSESIRKCRPTSIDDWRQYYYENVKSKEEIDELGKRLNVKITEVISAEVSNITEQDCVDYMHQMVIDRTFDGYMTEIKTIYELMEKILDIEMQPAPDEWDRKYNVDFYIEIGDKYIGIQIKPVSDVSSIPQIYKEGKIQKESHDEFTKKFGGKVFYVYSIKEGKTKKIHNKEVIEEIKKEIDKLENKDH